MKKWTVGKATWVHSAGFEWAIFWNNTERGTFKSKFDAQCYCDDLNAKQNINCTE